MRSSDCGSSISWAEGSAHYNIAHRFVLRGEFHERAFEQALQESDGASEVLRTHFMEQDGEPRQVIVEDYELPFTLHDLSQLPDEEKAAEAQRLMRGRSAPARSI